jgi:hypothetical protein
MLRSEHTKTALEGGKLFVEILFGFVLQLDQIKICQS